MRTDVPPFDPGDRFAALWELARLVAAALDLDALCTALHQHLGTVVDATGFALVLQKGEGGKLDVVLQVVGGKRQPPERLRAPGGVVEHVVRTGAPLLLADRVGDRARALGCEPREARGARSWILAPLPLGGRALGVLHAHNDERDFAFDERDLSRLALLASHAAVAIENARLFQAARAGEARYRSLFDASPLGVVVLDEEGKVRSANPAAERIFGEPASCLSGRLLAELAHPSQRAQAAELLEEAVAGCVPARREIRFVRPDGSERVTGMSVAPLRPEGGGAALAVIRDATHEHLLRQTLLQTEKLAAMGFLLSGIAHELNNPLAGIRGVLQVLVDDAKSEHRELLEMALRETDRAARRVQGVRDFGRRSSGKRERLSVNRLVEQLADLRGYALRNQNIELLCDCDASGPEVIADRDEVLQALMNLVQNAEQAVAAKPSGERRIRVTTRAAGAQVELAVSDTGPGIPPEIRDRIFDPFFTTKGPGEGTGLGLTVVHAIAEDHGGRVEVEDALGGGAVLRLILPCPRAPAPAAPAPAKQAGTAPGAGLRLLMVDDEPTIRSVVERWCRRQGVALTVATDGKQALATARAADFDVVMMDLRMPGMDGRQLYRALESERPHLARRVVFVTGDAMTGGTREFLESVGRPVLLKPFDLETLAERLSEAAKGAQ